MENFFNSLFKNGSGTSGKVTGKAADAGYTKEKGTAQQAANRETLASVFSLSGGSNTTGSTSSALGVQTGTQSTGSAAGRKVTGLAADSGSTEELRRAQQQFNRQTVGNLFQGAKNEVSKQSEYSLAKGTAGVLQKGLQQVAEAGGNTFAFAEDVALAPFELAFGRDLGEFSDKAPLNRWAQKIREEGDAVDAYYAENIKAGGRAAELYDYLGSSLIAAAPQAAAAVLTGGTSIMASTAGLQKQAASALAPGLATTIRNIADKAAQNPQYWLSFFQTVGNGYENAIADMEEMNTNTQRNGGNPMDSNSIRTKAALQAAGSGLMNAAIEVGGGLQTLPKELNQGGSVWKALVNSGIGEGKEEVLQGIVDRTSQNLVYNKGTPLISLTDPNAVLSLPVAAKEFAGGFAIGSLLGGGQAGVLSAAQAMQNNPITSYADEFRRLMDGNRAAANTNAENTASALTRYKELECKYLDGSIAEHEFEELRKLENSRKALSESAGGTWRTEENSYAEWDEGKSGDNHEAAEFFGVNGIGNLSSIVKRGTIKTQGGFECFPDGDPLKRNIQNVTPVDAYFDVAMHGTSDAVCFGGTERNMTARMLASVIRHSEGYTGQNIRLLSCSTGAREGDSPCFAEELANALGVTVQAPNMDLYIFEDGTFKVGRHGEGAFVEYMPNERRRLK